jgi:hypothetical protein
MTFMWRRYSPTTNRPFLASIRSSHLPFEGRRKGMGGAAREGFDRTLTNRTMPDRAGCSTRRVPDISRTISRPRQIRISVSKGSRRASSARSRAWVTGLRITKVPAAPMLTASRCFSCFASVAGRKVL